MTAEQTGADKWQAERSQRAPGTLRGMLWNKGSVCGAWS